MKPLVTSNGKILYACASEFWNGVEWQAEITHVHAENELEAKVQFWRSNERRHVRLVATAPAIGVWGEEKYNEVEDRRIVVVSA